MPEPGNPVWWARPRARGVMPEEMVSSPNAAGGPRFAGAEKGYFWNGAAYVDWTTAAAFVQYVKAHECNPSQTVADTTDIYLSMPGVRWMAQHTCAEQGTGVHEIGTMNADPLSASHCLLWVPFYDETVKQTLDGAERIITGLVLGAVSLLPIADADLKVLQRRTSDDTPYYDWVRFHA